jgi:phosphoglycerate kinase
MYPTMRRLRGVLQPQMTGSASLLVPSLTNASRIFAFQPSRGIKDTIENLAKKNPDLLQGSFVFVRVDFNVPLSKGDPSKVTIADDTRIREAVPTIEFLTKAGAKVVLASHVGRPDGKVNEKMRLGPMAMRLGELLHTHVATAFDCIGPTVDTAIEAMKPGDILMLDNVRFYKEEEENCDKFSRLLAREAKVFVNDAFGTAHRAHSSTAGVAAYIPHRVAGFLMAKELKFLKNAVDKPNRPFAAIVGGAKISTKIPVLESLIEKCDKIFLGGGMIFTFYKAMGYNIGKSVVEENMVSKAKDIIEKAKAKGVKLILPVDVVVADAFKADANSKTVDAKSIPEGWMGLDIGTASDKLFQRELADCKTIVWNGPMGVFEFDRFSCGTTSVAKTLAELTSNGATTIIGGGDSVAAVVKANLAHRMSHISTGGGASLEMLEGKELPGVACLDDA